MTMPISANVNEALGKYYFRCFHCRCVGTRMHPDAQLAADEYELHADLCDQRKQDIADVRSGDPRVDLIVAYAKAINRDADDQRKERAESAAYDSAVAESLVALQDAGLDGVTREAVERVVEMSDAEALDVLDVLTCFAIVWESL